MNLKNQSNNLIFIEAKDKKMLDKIFAFRFNIITNTQIFQDYTKNTNFEDKKETDIYDDYSCQFAALNKDGQVCASVRLIHHSEHGYPTQNCMHFDHSKFKKKHLGEISRIFISPLYRSLSSSKVIIHKFNKLLYAKMLQLDIQYTYGALEPRFIRLLRIHNMKYKILGKLQKHGKMGLRYPCILYTHDFKGVL